MSVYPFSYIQSNLVSSFYPTWQASALWYLAKDSNNPASAKYSLWRNQTASNQAVKIFWDDKLLDNPIGSVAFVHQTNKVYLTLGIGNTFKIAEGVLENNEIQIQALLSFNSDSYNIMHPALSKDGNQMIFSSNMAGFGKNDLYFIEKQLNGDWSIPLNLGSALNTPLNDAFPYWDPTSGLLFFASEGHAAIGGYDIFVSQQTDDGWQPAKPLPRPINSTSDDLGLCLSNAQNGFFASNRSGKDEIFKFDLLAGSLVPPKPVQKIRVLVDFFDPATQQGVNCSKIASQSTDFNLVKPMGAHQALVEVTPNKMIPFEVHTSSGKQFALNHTFASFQQGQKVTFSINENDLYRFKGQLVDSKTNIPIPELKIVLKDNCSRDSMTVESDQNGRFMFSFSSHCEEIMITFPTTDKGPKLVKLSPGTPNMERVFSLERSAFKPIKIVSNSVLLTKNCNIQQPDIQQLVKLLNNHKNLSIELRRFTLNQGKYTSHCAADYDKLTSLRSILLLKGVGSRRISIPCSDTGSARSVSATAAEGFEIKIYNPSDPILLNPLDWDFKIVSK